MRAGLGCISFAGRRSSASDFVCQNCRWFRPFKGGASGLTPHPAGSAPCSGPKGACLTLALSDVRILRVHRVGRLGARLSTARQAGRYLLYAAWCARFDGDGIPKQTLQRRTPG